MYNKAEKRYSSQIYEEQAGPRNFLLLTLNYAQRIKLRLC